MPTERASMRRLHEQRAARGRSRSGYVEAVGAGSGEKMKIKDITGRRFGRLTVIKVGKQEGYEVYWQCACDCGNVKLVRTSNIKKTKSCGCLKRKD
jgi:hypothetical protein